LKSNSIIKSISSGSSGTGGDEMVIQGDANDDLFGITPEKWPAEIDKDQWLLLKTLEFQNDNHGMFKI